MESERAAEARQAFVPVVWTGKSPEKPVSMLEKEADPARTEEAVRLKPNMKFLDNCIRQAVIGNQREVAANATKAACQALGSAARPELARAKPRGDAAVRRVALSAAKLQKLHACCALLREVAAEYGFSLRVEVPDEWEDQEHELHHQRAGQTAQLSQENLPAAPAQTDSDDATANAQSEGPDTADRYEDSHDAAAILMQPLTVRLEEAGEIQAAGATLVTQAALDPEGKHATRRGPEMTGRLASAALGALGQTTRSAKTSRAPTSGQEAEPIHTENEDEAAPAEANPITSDTIAQQQAEHLLPPLQPEDLQCSSPEPGNGWRTSNDDTPMVHHADYSYSNEASSPGGLHADCGTELLSNGLMSRLASSQTGQGPSESTAKRKHPEDTQTSSMSLAKRATHDSAPCLQHNDANASACTKAEDGLSHSQLTDRTAESVGKSRTSAGRGTGLFAAAMAGAGMRSRLSGK